MARCPVCKIQIERIPYEGVGVHHCGKCGGYWLTRISLDAILNRRELVMPPAVQAQMLKLAEESNSIGRLICVMCGVQMVKEPFKQWSGVQLDRCPRCEGLWFDRGELEKCQIIWERFQDDPAAADPTGVLQRKAEIEAELARQKSERAQFRDDIAGGPSQSWWLLGGVELWLARMLARIARR
jgi:Zn-finger nucleic acid-binding protein